VSLSAAKPLSSMLPAPLLALLLPARWPWRCRRPYRRPCHRRPCRRHCHEHSCHHEQPAPVLLQKCRVALAAVAAVAAAVLTAVVAAAAVVVVVVQLLVPVLAQPLVLVQMVPAQSLLQPLFSHAICEAVVDTKPTDTCCRCSIEPSLPRPHHLERGSHETSLP